MSLSNDSTMVMPVAPAYSGNCYTSNGNGMWGNDWASWLLLFVIFGAFGRGGYGGFGGFGGGDSCGCCAPATCSDMQAGFNNQAITNKLNGLENGLAYLGYDQLAQMNGINTNILNTGFGIQNAIQQSTVAGMQNTNALQTQISNCCCETQRQIERGFCDTNYNLATNTANIIQNAHDDTNRIIAKLNDMESARQAERIAALQAENQSLKFQASQTAQNAFISANQDAQTAELLRRLGRDCPVPAYVVQPPTPVQFNSCGCGCTTGCNTGCC